jgi:hypothetical protein
MFLKNTHNKPHPILSSSTINFFGKFYVISLMMVIIINQIKIITFNNGAISLKLLVNFVYENIDRDYVCAGWMLTDFVESFFMSELIAHSYNSTKLIVHNHSQLIGQNSKASICMIDSA